MVTEQEEDFEEEKKESKNFQGPQKPGFFFTKTGGSEFSRQKAKAIRNKYGSQLSQEQIERIAALQELEKSRKLQQYIQSSKNTLAQYKYAKQQAAYAETIQGKTSAAVQKAFQPGFLRRWSYGSQAPPKGYSATGQARIRRKGAGRPRGTLDPRYAKFGGVYGFRKDQSHQRQLEKLRLRQAANITPEQQQIINQINAQRMARIGNPEARTIPDTSGEVNMAGIMQEIDDAANIFP